MSKRESLQIGFLIDQVYQIISFDEGESPKIDQLENFFVEESRLIRKEGDRLQSYNITEFISSFDASVANGDLVSLYHEEVVNDIVVKRDLGSCWSRFKASSDQDSEPYTMGWNHFQLVKVDHRWHISQWIWEDDH